MPTRTKFVFLMHPDEFKRIKAGTGRLTHLSLAHSELHVGLDFDRHERVQQLIRDPANFPVLLYPARDARDLSRGELTPADLSGRQFVVFLLDATWHLVRQMWRASPGLHALPRIMFSGAAPSRYVIKRQPHPACLSTLEATHELLLALDRSGLDTYAHPDQLLALFRRMQEVQLAFAAESARLGRQRHAPRAKPATPPPPRAHAKRRRLFLAPEFSPRQNLPRPADVSAQSLQPEPSTSTGVVR